ncbi:MAG TPA: thiamine pyrophosphate-binding protein [Roseiarcus sp.]|jgi:acetolactate synthase-1/2/3 large subunit|nr:thiamine pyrophosphate-binding protein [Roseiarcus sp.]
MLKKESDNLRSGGRILVDQLVRQGVEHVFCVPGESYLAVLDALHDADLKVTVCRQEAGATMMAAASATLTGRPGICFVTRGPGATNAAHGLHIAEHDSTPLILFIGQVERRMLGRGAFQEMDYRAFLGPTVKWATQVEDAARIPEIVQRAFHVAMQGRPGPVAIALPEDVLTDMAGVADAMRVEPAPIWPGLTQMAELQKMLWAAKRPIAVVGGGGWDARATHALRRFAERFDLAVAASFRRASLFDGEHPNYAGEIGIGPNPRLKARIEDADLVLLVGGRMSEMPSQSYTLFDVPTPRQALVHVHPDPHEIGRIYRPALGIIATAPAFCAALEGLQPPNAISWSEQTRTARAEYLEWTDKAPAMPGAMQLGEAMLWLRGRLGEDAIVTNGAGNYAGWPGRFLRYRKIGAQIGPTSGSMGFGVPAAVGAKRVCPDRMVVSFSGDGCFLMNGQEFATAVQYDLPIVFIVIDNGMYGTIRMHQERDYPGRISATELKNPDFAAYARAFGGHGETVAATGEFAPAFERAVASGKPAILHVKIDPDAITPMTTLTAIRAKALAARK